MSVETVRKALMEVLSEEDAKAVIDHRRTTIKKPLTPRGAQLLAKQFAQVDDTTAAVDMMIERAWQGFKAEWFFQKTGRSTPAAASNFLQRRANQRLIN